jgi:hypothetical protein
MVPTSGTLAAPKTSFIAAVVGLDPYEASRAKTFSWLIKARVLATARSVS